MGSSKPAATSFVSTLLLVLAFLGGPWMLPEVVKPTIDIEPDEVALTATPEIPDALVGLQFERLDPQEYANSKKSHQDIYQTKGIVTVIASGSTTIDIWTSLSFFDRLLDAFGQTFAFWSWGVLDGCFFTGTDDLLLGISLPLVLIGVIVARNDIIEMTEDVSDEVDSDNNFASLAFVVAFAVSAMALAMTLTASLDVYSKIIAFSSSCWELVIVVFQQTDKFWTWQVFVGWFATVTDIFLLSILSCIVLVGLIIARCDIVEMTEDLSDEKDCDCCLVSLLLVLFCAGSGVAIAMTLTASFDIYSMSTILWNSMSCWDIGFVALREASCFWERFAFDALSIVTLLIFTILGCRVANFDLHEMSKEESDEGCVPFHILS